MVRAAGACELLRQLLDVERLHTNSNSCKAQVCWLQIYDNCWLQSAIRNLEIAKSNLSQAKLTLEELENSPTESEKLSANQSVKNAEQQLEVSKQQLQNAKINLEVLLKPSDSTLNSASASVVASQSAIVSAKNTINNTYVELLNSQKTYCDTRLTESQFEDQKAPVCSSEALPINENNITRLLDDIKSENEPLLTTV